MWWKGFLQRKGFRRARHGGLERVVSQCHIAVVLGLDKLFFARLVASPGSTLLPREGLLQVSYPIVSSSWGFHSGPGLSWKRHKALFLWQSQTIWGNRVMKRQLQN
jgi:hypothetical protein